MWTRARAGLALCAACALVLATVPDALFAPSPDRWASLPGITLSVTADGFAWSRLVGDNEEPGAPESPERDAREAAAFASVLAESQGESSDLETELAESDAEAEAEADAEVLADAIAAITAAPQVRWPVRVALHAGSGSSETSIDNVFSILRDCASSRLISVRKTSEFSDEAPLTRETADVIIFPGGRSGGMHRAHKDGRAALGEMLRAYVSGGGGYVGICGGAFVAKHVRLSDWPIKGYGYGVGTIFDMEVPPRAAPLLPLPLRNASNYLNKRPMFYANGPFFERPDPRNWTSDCALCHEHLPLLRVRRSGKLVYLASNGATRTLTRVAGRTIVGAHKFGHGAVVVSSGHPETEVVGKVLGNGNSRLTRSLCGAAQANVLIDMVLVAANRTREDVMRRLRRNASARHAKATRRRALRAPK